MNGALRRRFIRIFISVLVLFLTQTAIAQPPTKVDPKQIVPGEVDPKTLTPTQLNSLLIDKNPGEDVNKRTGNKDYSLDKDSTNSDNIKGSTYSPKNTYGLDVFSYAATTDLSELSTPPLDYPIGVGDMIVVSLWGGAEAQKEYGVARDGSIFPSGLGKMYVAGLTFENVRRLVASRFATLVPPGTNIAVSIGQPRSINVNVVGEVNVPGIQTVSAFSNAFNVIARAQGVTRFGDVRNIIIKRNGVVIDNIDVYKYLLTGDFGKHVYLQNNDFVIVGLENKKVFATGQFKRPMYYQLKENEGVKALLKFTGGLTPDALGSNMKVIRSEDESQKVSDVNANAILKIEGQDFMLKDGDIVQVPLIKAGIINKVQIKGEVKYPDYYEIRVGDRLYDVINRAGGITNNTYLNKAYVFRGAGDSTELNSDRLEVSLADYNDGNQSSLNNILLEPNDEILLFGANEFEDAKYVQIFGEVRNPGQKNKYGGMTLQDLLFLSGGLKQSAEYGRLEIASIVNIDSAKQGLKPTGTSIKQYDINSDLSVDTAARNIILKPYDQIFVRKNPTFELQKNISIRGLVKYPGLYSKIEKNERLSSFIKRAGGLIANANVAGAVMYRKNTDLFRESNVKEIANIDTAVGSVADIYEMGIKATLSDAISIDLYKALKYPNSKHDHIMQDKDEIFVPEINPFVTVQGIVQSPLKTTYDKEHTGVSYYVDKAGGFGIRPWKSRIFVKYANGRSRRTRNFFFFHFYPKVKEGSYVIVPQRPKGIDVGEIVKTTVLSAVPIVLTAIILKNLN